VASAATPPSRAALLEHVRGGVHDAGVDVAELLQGEEARAVFCVVEGVGGGLVDGHGTGVGARRRFLACVDLQSLISIRLLVTHGLQAPLCLRVFFRDERACAHVAMCMEWTFQWEPGGESYSLGNKKPATARAVRVLDSVFGQIVRF
jgi:hypothetical protein